MKINPGKSKAVRFTKATVKNPLGYSLCNQNIRKRAVLNNRNNLTKRFKMGGPSKLHSAKSLKALHFVMCVLKKGNRNTKSLTYMSLVRPVLEYGSACWNRCREGQINALYRVQKTAAQFTKHMKDSDWETMAQRRTIARLCALFKATLNTVSKRQQW